jgi:hypothetical protein
MVDASMVDGSPESLRRYTTQLQLDVDFIDMDVQRHAVVEVGFDIV